MKYSGSGYEIVINDKRLVVRIDNSSLYLDTENSLNLAIAILQAQGWEFDKVGTKIKASSP